MGSLQNKGRRAAAATYLVCGTLEDTQQTLSIFLEGCKFDQQKVAWQNLKWPSKCTCFDLLKSPSLSVRAIVAEYHKPGRWGTAEAFLIVLEGGESVVKALTLSVSGVHLVHRLGLLRATSHGRRSGGLFFRNTNAWDLIYPHEGERRKEGERRRSKEISIHEPGRWGANYSDHTRQQVMPNLGNSRSLTDLLAFLQTRYVLACVFKHKWMCIGVKRN